MEAILLMFCTFLLAITYPCHGCKPLDYNMGNSESVANNLKEILEPFRITLPVFNKQTVPESIIQQFQAGKENDDVNLNFTQLVTKYNYAVEEHEVQTSDGYLITFFRVRKNSTCAGTPVFLMPGLFCSSDDYIIAGPKSVLGYLLADKCYDVWIGNNRGNKYSRRHIKLSPDCGEFWDFSFNEIGRYDLTAMIDYILNITKSEKLIYVGHSQGCTSFFIMCSARPEYNKKISLMIALSAVVFMDKIRSPLIKLFSQPLALETVLFKAVGLYELLPRDALINTATTIFCGTPETAEMICQNILFLVSGFDYEQKNSTNLPVIWAHFPSGAATKQIVHYAQLVKSGRFANYDYGAAENIAKYGTPIPPDYPLKKVTCPVALFYSLNDWAISAIATERLLMNLPNVIEFYHVPFPLIEHFDYLYAKNVKELVNEEVITLAKKYA